MPARAASGISGGAGCVHDDGHAGEADEGAGDVVAIGAEAVQEHAPGEGASDEDAAVGGEDAPEVGVVLEGGDEAVGGERGDAGADPGGAAVFTDALPDQPGAADLCDGGDGEEDECPQDRHRGDGTG